MKENNQTEADLKSFTALSEVDMSDTMTMILSEKVSIKKNIFPRILRR